ncbi:MAG: serine/threonine-protein kinase, partial [Polyangiaceae bacterium]
GKAVDRRTDIFALGTTLWELTTDRRLFKKDKDLDTLRHIKDAIVPDPTELVAGYPPKLWATLKRSLQRDPNDRYATVKDMVKDLDECAASEGRTVSAGTLSEVMLALFSQERERQLAWINEVSEKPREEAASALNPYDSQRKFTEMGSKVEPPPGTLVPSSARDLPPAAPSQLVEAEEVDSKKVATKVPARNDDEKKEPMPVSSTVLVAPAGSRKWLIPVVALGSAAVVVALAALIASMLQK